MKSFTTQITALATILILSHISLNTMAYDTRTEAGIPGAFCECDAIGAFPGAVKLFSKGQLDEIKKKFTTVDRRRPIDRTEERYKQLNAIGQIVTEEGFGTGVLLPGNLVLTNAHIGKTNGDYVKFNIGQTKDKSDGSPRWTDTIVGKVVRRGDSGGAIAEDWALIQLDEVKVNANKKYGSISSASIGSIENLKEASENNMLLTAGYPGFKDPRYLWGEKNVKVKFDKAIPDTIVASSSSGMSGGAVLVEVSPGKFKLIGLVQGGGSIHEQNELTYRGGFSYDTDKTTFVNFLDPRFRDDYVPAFRGILETRAKEDEEMHAQQKLGNRN